MTFSTTLPDGVVVSIETNPGGHIMATKRGRVVSSYSLTPEESKAMAGLLGLVHAPVIPDADLAKLFPKKPKEVS